MFDWIIKWKINLPSVLDDCDKVEVKAMWSVLIPKSEQLKICLQCSTAHSTPNKFNPLVKYFDSSVFKRFDSIETVFGLFPWSCFNNAPELQVDSFKSFFVILRRNLYSEIFTNSCLFHQMQYCLFSFKWFFLFNKDLERVPSVARLCAVFIH